MIHSSVVKSILAAFLICMLHFTASAQSDKQTDNYNHKLLEKQLSNVVEYFKKIDKDILKAFEANPKLKQSMEQDIKKLAEIKDDNLRKKEITAYQNKYIKDYTAIMLKAGYTPSKLESELNKNFPDLNFTVSKKFEIGAMPKSGVPKTKMKKEADPPQTTTVINLLTLPNFLFTGGPLDCHLISTCSSDKISNRNIRVTTGASVAGGGTANGSYRIENYEIPQPYTKAELEVGYEYTLHAYAISVVGIGFSMSSFSSNSKVDGYVSHLLSAIAPILWAMWSEYPDEKYGKIVLNENKVSVDFDFRTFSLAEVLCNTGASSEVKNIIAKLYITH